MIAFLFLIATFASLWIRRDGRIWGALLGLSLLCGLAAGLLNWIGLAFIAILLSLWLSYNRKPTVPLFIAIVAFSLLLKMRLLPGYTPHFLTPKFAVGLEGSLIGLFPLALLVPLARSVQDWKSALKGLLIGCGGIALLAIFATVGNVTHWQFKLPTFATERILSNLFLTSIPEEGFYRGFIQNIFCQMLKHVRFGKIIALIATSVLFTAAHAYWSPNIEVLAFVFLASLLYGGVYLISGKIESAILCHFLLNLIHMVFFSYHAM